MAGNRRRSRVRDTQSLRKHSQPASIGEASAATEASQDAEIAESTDEVSPRHGPPANRSTKAFCRNCRSNIGDFYNSFHKVTNSYFVPTLLGSYHSLLKSTGKQKAAAKGTDLEGCTIQPLSCPGPGCSDLPIGFIVVDAPAGKRNFRGRDFFKLSRIELRCEVSPTETILVEPLEDSAPELLTVEESRSPTPDPARPPTASSSETMEIDSRPPPSQHAGHHHLIRHEQHHEHSLQHQPLQQVEANRQPLPPPSSMRSPPGLAPLHSLPQKAVGTSLPSPSPAIKPIREIQHPPQHSQQLTQQLPQQLPQQLSQQLPPREPLTSITNVTRELPPVASQARSPHEVHHANGHQYPRSPREVGLDAIERLQTQISQNSGALAAQSRDIRRGEESFQQLEDSLRREFQAQIIRQSSEIRRVDEAVATLHLDIQAMRQAMDGLGREIHATRVERHSRGSTVPPGPSVSVQDSALELMAQQIAIMSQKANEVDSLKITIEIMKNKIQRLEEGAVSAPAQPTSQAFQSPRENTTQTIQSVHNAITYHPASTTTPHASQGQPPKPQVYHSHGTPTLASTPDVPPRAEPAPVQGSGWATVNAGVKRTHQNGAESPSDGTVQAPGSPKRQRLATAEHHTPYPASQIHYDAMHTESSEARSHAYATAVPPQTLPEALLASQSQHSVYIPYGTQDGPPDDSWRPESQRNIEHRPRGRGRGGGPGSRGGRGRKSMPAQIHTLGTPEWERDEWSGVPESQTSPDGYYNHAARAGRGIARRGSGGGGGGSRGGYTPSDRAVSLGLQGVTAGMGMGSPGDPYAHTKKTRTKPIRNADGVLIRKDGRPDMRSQSSAANLRKVHARKEGDPNLSPSGFTPTHLHYANSADAPDTPSPSGHAPEQDVTASVHKRHNAIMDKMFPSGVDESRKQHDYSRQVFEENRDHTVHPRTQHHHTATTKAPPQVKQEESHPDDDVDMGQAEDEGQTPGEQSDHSGREYQEPSVPAQQPEAAIAVPETQATESSATVAAESTQAATAPAA